jgi:hypothetical protein
MRRSSGLKALVPSLLTILPALQQNVPTGCITLLQTSEATSRFAERINIF